MEGLEIDKPPFFDGVHFLYWKNLMECYIQSIDFDLWDIILDGFSCKPKLFKLVPLLITFICTKLFKFL
jgi:hypothetical protein